MEEMKSAAEDYTNQMADLVQKLSTELRSGIRPAYDDFISFIHAIHWTEPWLMGSHALFVVTVILTRKCVNFQMCLFLPALSGVYFAENLNRVLCHNWGTFASQNYFDPRGLFLSALWSGPLLVLAMIILINTFFSLCYLVVRWKRAELRHWARLSRSKQD